MTRFCTDDGGLIARSRNGALLSGRPYLTTEEAAQLLGLRPQTLRKAYSLQGRYFSVTPKKAANRRLYWNADAVNGLIEGSVK